MTLQRHPGVNSENGSYDVVVVGSGASGLTAALSAADQGLTVLVVEGSHWIGGASAWSAGTIWVPRAGHAAAELDAERAAVLQYIAALAGEAADDAISEAFVSAAPSFHAFLDAHDRWLRFDTAALPDYHPSKQGAAPVGRTLKIQPLDGRRLGSWASAVRPPRPEALALGGLQIGPVQQVQIKQWWKTRTAFRTTVTLMARHLCDRIFYRRSTQFLNGNALVGRLVGACLDKNVHLRLGQRATELIRRAGRVEGVMLECDGDAIEVRASRGVVLATGGFSANEALRARYFPSPQDHVVVMPHESRGDGLRIGQEAGARLGDDHRNSAIWVPASVWKRHRGDPMVFPHLLSERCKPGSLIVDHHGERFVSEAASYHELVSAMHENEVVPAWLIGDSRFVRSYGMGFCRAGMSVRPFLREGYLLEADSIETLARQIGVNGATLAKSVSKMNAFAKTGCDTDFGRGSDDFSRAVGDQAHTPNPALGTLSSPPFYALPLYPSDCGTTIGLKTNGHAQVLEAQQSVIPGLYAVGLDMHNGLGGAHPGAGSALGLGMTFGYLAGVRLAQEP